MAMGLPDKGAGASDIQSIVFGEYLKALWAGVEGVDCVLVGCACTAQGSPDMTVAVSKGAVLTNGILKAVAAGNVTITTANSTNPRIDLIVVDSSGTKQVRAGTAAANPAPPTRTANDVILAVVYIPASDVTISTNQISDIRVMRTQGPIVIYRTTTQVTFNTNNTIQTYMTLTIPNGLFLSGRVLRVRCGGNYLSNSGTGTWTLTISYGGTTLFADATAATAADTDRKAWTLDFDLAALTSSSQALDGIIKFQTPGTVTAPASGLGDMAVVTHVIAPLRGTAAVDSDAADRTLTVQWTMSVSNSAAETVLDYATVELL